ncbi:hypothetical protein GCM10009021_14960 [Halarchaeum nitratireducens]|uniref:Uncharacterized protein n=1 Tax=Halarchaeum nitratireducens TaxID=489913 RepID=A0A830GA77_9EURY|nr:hypothetical protein GCM10009021_14960 [Halarchaeum nitratireducens]
MALVGVRRDVLAERAVQVGVDVADAALEGALVGDDELHGSFDVRVVGFEALDGANPAGLVAVDPADDGHFGRALAQLFDSHWGR